MVSTSLQGGLDTPSRHPQPPSTNPSDRLVHSVPPSYFYPNHRITQILAGKLFDPNSLEVQTNRVITVSDDTGLILNVEAGFDSIEPVQNGRIIDLKNATVLPGFVDVHVHFFLHPYSETSWQDQLTKEPLVERTIRATVHAKQTLMAGYTTVRDLGTEGAGDADIALRKCLSGKHPIIMGPRYFCANRAIVSTGSYGPKGTIDVHNEGVMGITGADAADGPDECRKVVRRQVGAGADWIKVYADYRVRSRIADVDPTVAAQSMRTFNNDELKTLIETAHFYGIKVAAHTTEPESIDVLLHLGVDSIEHAPNFDAPLLRQLAESAQTMWVPTLSVYYLAAGPAWIQAKESFQTALALDINNIACGGDTGTFAHGDNALEMKLMVSLGADWKKVLSWATFGGWKCVRSRRWGEERLRRIHEGRDTPAAVGDHEVAFGVIGKGFVADIIATVGDFDKDFNGAVSPENISFVMKGGRVCKLDGRSVLG